MPTQDERDDEQDERDDEPAELGAGETKLTREEQREESAAYALLSEQLAKGKYKNLPNPPFDATLVQAVRDAQRFSKSAKPRQIRRVAGLLRQTASVPELREALEGRSPALLAQREAERVALEWRTRLIEEGDPALSEFIGQHHGADRSRLRQLVRSAGRTPPDAKSKKAGKTLLREIRALRGEADAG